MRKTYCDICGDEITDKNKMPDEDLVADLGINNSEKFIKVKLYISDLPKNTDCCKNCVIDSVKKMDDRNIPQPSPTAPTDFQGEHK